MDDLTQTLLSFINNPENKEKIEKIKESFMNTKSEEGTVETKENVNKGESVTQSVSPDTLKTISKIVPLISSVKKEDSSTKFLSALRPLLSEKRQLKLDESVKILKMIKILPLLKDKGLL